MEELEKIIQISQAIEDTLQNMANGSPFYDHYSRCRVSLREFRQTIYDLEKKYEI